MTVAELIRELERIENQNLEVVCIREGDFEYDRVEGIDESREYFGLQEENGFVMSMRDCVRILGQAETPIFLFGGSLMGASEPFDCEEPGLRTFSA